jgi:hypothetical protein
LRDAKLGDKGSAQLPMNLRALGGIAKAGRAHAAAELNDG